MTRLGHHPESGKGESQLPAARQALLTGRNHHTVGMGGITEIATSAPGYNSILPNTCSPLARTLKLNGYSTSQFGKCHEVPVWQTSPMGPFDAWPTGGGGFEYFYGFIGGETNQWYPALYEGTTPVEPEKTPEEGYHLTDDMTTKAIKWIRQQKALMPDKPFFTYFAPGATHAPHHVPKEWADKYKGKFDQGWDKLREETFARQKKLGVIPAGLRSSPQRHPEIPAWDTITPVMKTVLAREMEVYAGFMEHTDHHVGRLMDSLEDLGILDDTLIYLIIGDNGASAEGSLQGCFNEMAPLTGFPQLETPEFLTERLDKLGGVEAYNHYAVGWAHAMDTPYQWTKQVASHFGGTRNGTIVHWPKGIKAKGELRSQFHHVIDVAADHSGSGGSAPAGLCQRRPADVRSKASAWLYSFNDAKAAERRETQYFEMAGNRGIYHKGWTAVTRHRTPWLTGHVKLPAFDDDVWELYDTNTRLDPVKGPGEGESAEAARAAAAVADRSGQVQRPAAGRPLCRARQSRDRRPAAVDQGHAADPVRRHGSAHRELDRQHQEQVARGNGRGRRARIGRRGRHRRPGRDHRRLEPLRQGGQAEVLLQLLRRATATRSRATSTIPPGTHQVRMEFAYDGGGLAKGGTVTLYIDGKQAGEGRVDQTEPIVFSADETCDVGFEAGSPVTYDYPKDSEVQRRGELGRDRPRQGRRGPRSPDLTRGTPPGRDGHPIVERAAGRLPL